MAGSGKEGDAPFPWLAAVSWFLLYAAVAVGFALLIWWLLARAAVATGWMQPGSALFITVFVVVLLGLPLGLVVGYASLIEPRIRRRRIAAVTTRIDSDPAGALKELIVMARADLETDNLHGVYQLVPLMERACPGDAKPKLAALCGALNRLSDRLTRYGRPGYGSHMHEDLAMMDFDDAVTKALEELEAR